MHSGLRDLHLPPITVDVPVDKMRATGCGPCWTRPGVDWMFYEQLWGNARVQALLPACQAGHAVCRFPFNGF